MELNYLFSPGNIGTLLLKNRIILPAMGTGMPEKDGYVSRQLIEFHLARVKGGCGLNIIENSAVREDTKAPHVVGIYDDRFIPGLKELTDGIHKAGGKACIQIWHAGRQTRSSLSGHPVVGPSPIACPVNREVPKELSVEEIQDLVDAFANAADRAKRAGFDAVEIHGAHGYLITQFMSLFSNRRTDEYGGTLINRTRFSVEIISAIRKKVGRGYPLLFRMSVEERVDGGLTMEDSKQIAPILEKAGVNAIHVSMGNYASIQFVIPPIDLPLAFNVENSAAIKQTVSIPVITAGRINDPILAEKILKSGKADFVSIGRGQLADPEFGNKAFRGEYDDIVKCVACNQGCVDRRLYQMTSICCMRNPSCGREIEYTLVPTKNPQKIMVIGGGPAGLEAATTLKRRGHDVILCEKSNRLGGAFYHAGIAPRKFEMMDAALQMGRLAVKAGIEIRLETPVTPELIKAVDPQVIIVATGSTPIVPEIPGIKKPHVLTSIDVLSGKRTSGKTVAVVGGGLVGVEVAELLLKQEKKIVLVEMLPKIAGELGKTRRGFSIKGLEAGGAKIFTGAKCMEIRDTSIVIEQNEVQKVLENINAVVVAVGFRPDCSLVDYLKNSGREYYVIGDAHLAGKALDAIWEAAELARNI